MLKRAQQRAGVLAVIAAAAGGCGPPPLDANVSAGLSGIRISTEAPAGCRYAGEAVSFNKTNKHYATADPFDIDGKMLKVHDEELKLHAQKLGANYVQTVYVKETGLQATVRVNAFFSCAKAT
jgi:hypothetical protein